MSNLSYCRFQNTLGDLRDCADFFDDTLGKHESYARERMMKMIRSLAELCPEGYEFSVEEDDEEEEDEE